MYLFDRLTIYNLYAFLFVMDRFAKQRKEMADICAEMGIKDKQVLDAMMNVPRHLFVAKEMINESYENYPLSIGSGQTISQPYTVAFMLEAIELKKGDKVLEVGTGSGWNAALIAEIVKPGEVFTTEIVEELIKHAERNLKKYKNVYVIKTDGSCGYKKEAPYDKIIVTAACPSIPRPLIEQLKEGGILVAPVGGSFGQKMIKGIKRKGRLIEENLGDFVFVPLIGKYGY